MGSPPLTTWSDTDHSGAVIITTVLAFVYWLVPGLIQQAISLGRRNVLSWVDGLFVTSMLFGSAQAVLVLVACSHGLGKSARVLHDVQIATSMRLYHASNVLYVLVLGFTKSSTTLSVVRLTVPSHASIQGSSTKNKRLFGVLLGLTGTWMMGSVVALALQCDVGGAISAKSKSCDSTLVTWASISGVDAVTDLMITGFAASIIWPVKAPLRLKLVWYMPFVIRICVIACSGVRLVAYHPADLKKDPTIAIWLFAVLSQIQIFLSVIATGFPSLRKTVLDLVTNFGVSEGSLARSTHGRGYTRSSLVQKKHAIQMQNSSPAFAPYVAGHGTASTVITAGMSSSVSDHDSRKGIIREDEFDVVITSMDALRQSSI